MGVKCFICVIVYFVIRTDGYVMKKGDLLMFSELNVW